MNNPKKGAAMVLFLISFLLIVTFIVSAAQAKITGEAITGQVITGWSN